MRQLSLFALTAVVGRLRPVRRPTFAPSAVLAVVFSAAAVGLWVYGHVLVTRNALTGYDIILYDGTFQLFNPLRRIAAGQTGGVDFQFFHGLGIPYLHYPLFALFGGDWSAAEWSRQFVSLAAGLIGYGLPLWAITRRLGAAVALMVPVLILHDALGHMAMTNPGGSLLGVRAVMPMVAFSVVLYGFGRFEPFLAGAAAGVGLLTGTEHGMAAAVGLAAVWLGRASLGLPGGGWRYLAAAVGTFVPTVVGLLLLIGGPAGLVGALRYAFVQIPADQFWYFGVPPNVFLDAPGKVVCDRNLMPTVGKAALLLAAAGWWAVAAPLGRAGRDRAVVFAGMAVYAGMSTVGYLGYAGDTYMCPARRVFLVVGVATAWAALRAVRAASPAGLVVYRSAVRVYAGFALCLVLTGWGYAGMSLPKAAWPSLEGWPAPVAPLAPIPLTPNPDKHFKDLAGWVREHGPADRKPVVWSEYASLLETELGVFHPHCDYIIHALGPNARTEYVSRFRAATPDFVVTFRRSYSAYSEWLQLETWPFYEEVARNYEPVGQTFAATLWKRTANPWQVAGGLWEWTVPVAAPGNAVMLPVTVPDGDVLVVEADYEVGNPAAKVPLLGKTPRHLVHPAASKNTIPTSLPDYEKTWAWPVQTKGGQPPVLFVGTQGPLGVGEARMSEVRVRRLPLTDAARKALFDP